MCNCCYTDRCFVWNNHTCDGNIYRHLAQLPCSSGHCLNCNGRCITWFADIFKRIFINKNYSILILISLKFAPNGVIDNKATLVQVMAWRRKGDKPLPDPMLSISPTHICVTRERSVKVISKTLWPSYGCEVIMSHTGQFCRYNPCNFKRKKAQIMCMDTGKYFVQYQQLRLCHNAVGLQITKQTFHECASASAVVNLACVVSLLQRWMGYWYARL